MDINQSAPRRHPFLSVLLWLLGIAALAFLLLVGYYSWQIKYGNGADLAREFRTGKFTADASLAGTGSVTPAAAAAAIRSHNPVRGKADAPITVIAFLDFECPFSRESYPITRAMADKYAPVVRTVFKHLPIEALHPNALPAANAAACAGEQGKFREYYDALFETEALDAASLSAHARSLGLNESSFASCLNARAHQGDIDEDIADAKTLGIRGTPTYIVNGVPYEGVIPADVWDRILADALRTNTL
jgi:protein-disulfide isomerase